MGPKEDNVLQWVPCREDGGRPQSDHPVGAYTAEAGVRSLYGLGGLEKSRNTRTDVTLFLPLQVMDIHLFRLKQSPMV